jgi:regulator of nucleoside diphosphate kinase
MRLRPMTLSVDDYSKLRSLLFSKVASVFSDPAILRDLHQELSRARLVEPDELPDDVITINSNITLRDIRSDALETYVLVEPTHADIANRRLSILSPVGVAVLGCRTGDDIHWPVASGWRRMKVEKVRPPVRQPAPVPA